MHTTFLWLSQLGRQCNVVSLSLSYLNRLPTADPYILADLAEELCAGRCLIFVLRSLLSKREIVCQGFNVVTGELPTQHSFRGDSIGDCSAVKHRRRCFDIPVCIHQ